MEINEDRAAVHRIPTVEGSIPLAAIPTIIVRHHRRPFIILVVRRRTTTTAVVVDVLLLTPTTNPGLRAGAVTI